MLGDDVHHDESPAQRLDRNISELLQELRVAQAGVQLLFAFLLTLAFTQRFTETSGAQQVWYVVTLLLCAAAAALLIGPVSVHRIVFRRGMRGELVSIANAMAIGGLAFLLAAIVSALGLIIDFVYSWVPALILSLAVTVWFVVLWYVVPWAAYVHDRRSRPHIATDDAAH
jgi:Family of unknown function (DUF6328)